MPSWIAASLLAALAQPVIAAQPTMPKFWQYRQTPDKDGVYYVGPEVSEPKLIKTVYALYPSGISAKQLEGMTVMAMIVDAKGRPSSIELLHPHGEYFDRAAMDAVKQSVFEPGKLNGRPVPVWIDVRVVYYEDRSKTTPQVVIAERDLPVPADSRFLDKQGNLKPQTAPVLIHTVDADYVDPFAKHPYVQIAKVNVLVGKDGVPRDDRVSRGLGFGLDEKAKAAVMQYRFIPATRHGLPVEAETEVLVPFATF